MSEKEWLLSNLDSRQSSEVVKKSLLDQVCIEGDSREETWSRVKTTNNAGALRMSWDKLMVQIGLGDPPCDSVAVMRLDSSVLWVIVPVLLSSIIFYAGGAIATRPGPIGVIGVM